MRDQPDHRWQYAALAVLFVLAVMCQVRSGMDAIRDLANTLPRAPFELSGPWPSIGWVMPEASAAGLSSGDHVLSVDGRRPGGVADFIRAVRGRAPGDPLTVEASRGGSAIHATIRLAPIRAATSAFAYTYAAVLWFALPALSLALGFWVAAIRPSDTRAWMLLAMMLGFIQFLMTLTGGIAPQGWPGFLRVPALAYTAVAENTWPIWMMLFGLYFPQRWKLDRRAPWLKWLLIVPLAVQATVALIWTVGISERFETVAFLGPTIGPVYIARAVLWLLAIPVFFLGLQIKTRDPAMEPDSRRRLVLLHTGSSWSFVPSTLLCIWAAFAQQWPLPEGPALLFALVSLFGFPLTMAYVIVVQRAMDVKVVVRMGVQYALAQGTLRTLQILCSAGVGFVALLLALDPNTVRPRKIMLIAGGVVALVLIRRFSGTARLWVDRRFFREAYETDRILSELSEDVRTVTDPQRLLEMVARRISESLHVDRVAAVVRTDGFYEPVFALGYPDAPPARFEAGCPLLKGLERDQAPIDLSQSDGLSDPDRVVLQELKARLVLPLAGKGGLLGFLSLGPKRSEEPYSKTDVRLLRSVAAQTGLALDNARLIAAVAAETAKREVLNREIEIAREV